MIFRKIILVVILILVCGSYGTVQAASDMSYFEGLVNNDFGTIASYVNSPFVSSLGFFTSLGWDANPTVYDLTTGPHFSVSIGAGADFIPLPNLKNLNTSVVSATESLNLPSGMPLPYPIVTARVGLFNGFDIGFRYTYLPPVNVAGIGGNYNGWGIDLRYKILDGMQLPTVTLSTSFDTMSGNFSLNTGNISQTGLNFTNPSTGNTYTNASVSGSSNYGLNWSTQSVGAKITVGKNLGILYPYAGIGFLRNSGTITSSITGNFTGNLGGGGGSTSFNASGVSSGAPVLLEPDYMLGFTLGAGLGLNWSVVGESNGIDIAGTTSFGLQF